MDNEIAKKAYALYKKVTSKTFLQVTTTQLNIIHNILCRINRDGEYAAALADFKTGEGEPIKVLIEKYFEGYNNLYGLDIRETLTEFDDPDLAEGGYFILTTYANEGGTLVERKPTEFERGEVATVRAKLFSHSTKEPLTVKRLTALTHSDDGVKEQYSVEDSSEIEFTVTLSREGMVKFKVIATEDGDKQILGIETAFGGVLFSRDDIRPTHKPPEDLIPFWCSQIDRMVAIDPTSTTPDGYVGDVEYLHDMPSKNYYKLIRIDADYFEKMKKNGQPTPSEGALEKYDFFEVNLKAPGPCPSTAYLSVPKGAEERSLPIRFTFDGYSVRCPAPEFSESMICVHCSHHGYELGREDKSYYEPVRKSVAANYGRGNGGINAGYKNIRDCYMTYLILRDLQMIRFCTDPTLSYETPELHEKWNGEIVISGGSMGGYQTLAVGALTVLLRRVSAPFKVARLNPSIPAFCNIAAMLDNRVPNTITKYEEGCDYFDPALLSHLIDAPVIIPRSALGDETCVATGITAMLNSVPKGIHTEINYLQNSSHGYLPDPEYQSWYKYTRD